MAVKFPGFKFFSAADTKSRIFLIFAVAVVIVMLIFFTSRFLGGNGNTLGSSRVAAPPASAQSIPGSNLTPAYYQALREQNAQAVQKAQLSGGSAVPTMLNIPNQPPELGTNNCTILCPGEENANVINDINNLESSGKLSKEDAAKLRDLANKNVSAEEYAAALDDLVKQGKLTPEQARELLAQYKKQHENGLLTDSAKMMDAMIKAGQLPLDTANQLLLLQKNKIPPADYAAELDRLVKQGKISPAVARQLLAQYAQQQNQEATKKAIFGLKQLAKAGAITPDVAADLAELQAKNVPVDAYAAELQRLVAEGKLTPAEAARLLEQYKAKRAAAALGALDALAASDSAAKRAEAKKLLALQGNNATVAEYTDELKRAVQAGVLTPDEASKLLQEYQTMTMPASLPLGAGVEMTLPTTEDFAKLQQRVQQQQATSTATVEPETGQFTAAANQAESAAWQARQQRIQALESAMSSQAQSLISTAWQSPRMAYQGGSVSLAKATSAEGAPSGATSQNNQGTSSSSGESSSGAPLIKAGSIMFAVLDTAVDSDYPDTPVLATIVQGPFKGAKLLGKLALAQGMDKVSLNFTLMDKEDWAKTKTVSAFAIDPDTARSVLASNVNYHYMKRYGSLFASSFLTGYANGILSEGTSTTGIFGTSSTHPGLSPGNKFAVGLGQVGTTFGNAVANYINTPATVKVNAGVGLGILFMSAVT